MQFRFATIGAVAGAIAVLFVACGAPVGTAQLPPQHPKAYSVSYDANGGSGTVPAPVTLPSGTSVTVSPKPSDLARTGYAFSGWNTKADGTGTPYAPGSSLTIASANVTLYAAWTLSSSASFTITYDGNGATGGTAPPVGTSAAGASVTLATNSGGLVKTGFDFSGWAAHPDGTGANYAVGASYTMGSANVTLYARWVSSAAPTYTITYDGNGATGGTAPPVGTSAAGASVTLATNSGALVKDGFDFSGWAAKADGTGANYAVGASYTMGSANVTLYAKWVSSAAPKYAFTYDANGGTGAVPTEPARPAGYPVVIAGNTGNLAKNGLAFIGWNTLANGTGTTYEPGSTYSMTSAAVTLYAVWSTTAKLSYNANGGAGTAPSGGDVTPGATITVPGQWKLSKNGSFFAGWNTNAAGTGTNYLQGATLPMPAAPLVLYAKWVAAPAPPSAGWANVKFGGGGYVPGLIFHPTVANILYARTDVAGAYRWESSSSTWIPITDMFNFTEGSFQGIETIALDPTDANKVYLVGGMYVTNGNARLYTSSNKGATWTYVELPFPSGGNNVGRAIGERLMVDPNKPSVLFYATRTQGLWKSTDSGVTWSQVTGLSTYKMSSADIGSVNNNPIGIEGVVFDTAVPTSGFTPSGTPTQTIYVSVAPDYMSMAGLSSYIYKSTNGGANWTGVTIPSLVTTFTNDWQKTPIKPYIPHMTRDTDSTANRKFYVVFTGAPGPGAGGPCWLYSFDGTNWSSPLKSAEPTQWTSPGFGGVSVSGTGASTRIALGETNSWGAWNGMPVVAYSKDSGATWTEIADNRTSPGWIDDVEINPFNPENVLHVFGGGVWATSNASSATPTWTSLVDGIEELATISLMAPPVGASYVLAAGYGDVGTQVHTNVDTKPTTDIPANISFGNGNGVDMAWTDPTYIAAIGTANGIGGNTSTVGVYSTNSGVTWTPFPTQPPFAPAGDHVNQGSSGEANIAVTAPGKLVWAPSAYNNNGAPTGVPYYTTDNGATWTATNLPPPTQTTITSAYHLAADRQNADKVYAYDSGGADWTGTSGKFYLSTDGGKTFTKSTDATISGMRWHQFTTTWLAVNPNAEGDVWLANGDNLYHSTDSGMSWTKLSSMASSPATYDAYGRPTLFGALRVALGKPVAGSTYSAAVYLVGTVNGTAGIYRSDDAGSTWKRINDDAHQWGGIGALTADNSVAGRVYLAGRGVLYNF